MKTVHPDSVLVINKSYNLLILRKLHYLFTDLFTVYDFKYFWIHRNALKENLTINDYGAIQKKRIAQEVENKRTCMLLLFIISF